MFDWTKLTCRRSMDLAIALLLISAMSGTTSANAQEGASGITQRTVFPAFNWNAPSCNAPSGLRKVLAYVQENDRDFLQGVDHGLAMATKYRGLVYRRVLIQNNTAKAIEQIQS